MANAVEFSIVGRDKFSKTLGKSRQALNDTVKIMSGFGVTAAIAMGVAAKAIIDVGSKTEDLRIRMNAMLGSVAEGNKVFQDMTEFAGQVPFSYDAIMESATQLSGVMKGGVKEINEWMPMIADLAAVSGLSIEQTTEQVVRMYSAGAGAADLFRERGITSMLGFQAGVSYSAEETKTKLIEAFETPMSKFRGAANELSTTWTGVMSMIGDKWFTIKSVIADSGLFNYFKAIAIVIDEYMGKAFQNTKDNAAKWSNSIIDGIRTIVNPVAFMADVFRGLEAVWDGLKVIFSKFIESTIFSIYKLVEGFRELSSWVGIDIGPFETLENVLTAVHNTTEKLGKEFKETIGAPMPSEHIEAFADNVEMAFLELQEKSAEMRDSQIDDQKRITEETLEQLDQRIENTRNLNQTQIDLMTTYAEELSEIYDLTMADIFNNMQSLGDATSDIISSAFSSLTSGIGDAVASAIVDGESLSASMGKVLKNVAKQVISNYIAMGVQRWIMAGIFQTATFSEASSALSASFALAYANAFETTA